MTAARWMLLFLAGALLALPGCSSESSNPATPPSGWQTEDGRWWKEGVDTTRAFRPMEDLSQMGITPEEFAINQSGLSQGQFNDAIKRTLINLYRNDPETIDSLFMKYAAPKMEDADLQADDVIQEGGMLNRELRDEYKNTAYQAINSYYREPRRKSSEDGPGIVYPDSLRTLETSGSVKLQVHLSLEGEGREAVARPDAIRVLEGVHPTLDAIAMNAAAQAEWQPAFVKKDGDWRPQPAWVRFDITYPAPQQ